MHFIDAKIIELIGNHILFCEEFYRFKKKKNWQNFGGGLQARGSSYEFNVATRDAEFAEVLRKSVPSSTVRIRSPQYSTSHMFYVWHLGKRELVMELVERLIPRLKHTEICGYFQSAFEDMKSAGAYLSARPAYVWLPKKPSPLALWRIRKGLSQHRVAQLAKCSFQMIAQVEQGRYGIGPIWDKRLAKLTGDAQMGVHMRHWIAAGKPEIPPAPHLIFDQIIPNSSIDEPCITIPEPRLRALRYGAPPRAEEIEEVAYAVGWKPEALSKVWRRVFSLICFP